MNFKTILGYAAVRVEVECQRTGNGRNIEYPAVVQMAVKQRCARGAGAVKNLEKIPSGIATCFNIVGAAHLNQHAGNVRIHYNRNITIDRVVICRATVIVNGAAAHGNGVSSGIRHAVGAGLRAYRASPRTCLAATAHSSDIEIVGQRIIQICNGCTRSGIYRDRGGVIRIETYNI